MIPVYKPYFTKDNLKYAHDAIDSTWVSSSGKYLELSEELLKEYLGVNYIILTNNGTNANHLMAKALMKRTNTKSLLVPSNAYVAAWNPFLYDKFFNLVPVDMDLETWNADLDGKLHLAENLLVVHNLGNIVNVPEIKKNYPHLNIVEDACEAFGGMYCLTEKDTIYVRAGTEGLCSAFSFYGNKNITSGEGGAFVTNDEELYKYTKLIWGQGQTSKKFVHSELGYNYRMTNVQAAILYGQLLDYALINHLKNALFFKYLNSLSDVEGISLQKMDDKCSHAGWMFGVRFHGNPFYQRAEEYFKIRGIETRPFFYTINTHNHLRGIKRYPKGTVLQNEIVIFPSYPELSRETESLNRIIEEIKNYARILENSVF